ncbi:hypothetical protein ARMGADRAFT_1034377 [Armillaria gallica]|uniref:Uncharacterized protein n=1 Tax=Armillaria gallica TaxID=47427 RepID=A0A2H3DKZ1_ARMGA|nr:hypothetical protein ARMGADRAFT_1034377 [Armillaria gallica]
MSLLQELHFNTTAPHCSPVHFKNQTSPMHDCSNNKNIHTNIDLRLYCRPLFQPATPLMSSDDTPTGNLTFTLLPADGFPEIQDWTKSGTVINLSNHITQITNSLTSAIQGITGNKNICLLPPVLTHGPAKRQRDCLISQQFWSINIITFFVISFTPKPLMYLTTIHKLTHPIRLVDQDQVQ